MAVRTVLSIILTACGCIACTREPRLGVDVTGGPTAYVLAVKSCDTGQAVGAAAIAVYDSGGKGICGVRWRLGDPHSLISNWTYGLQPEGYEMSECEPLQTGVTYHAHIGGRNFADRTFRIRDDRTVEMLEAVCPP